MDAYDKNRDGRIDIRELAQLLPIEESFKLLFKFETQVDSSVEFMRVSVLKDGHLYGRYQIHPSWPPPHLTPLNSDRMGN